MAPRSSRTARKRNPVLLFKQIPLSTECRDNAGPCVRFSLAAARPRAGEARRHAGPIRTHSARRLPNFSMRYRLARAIVLPHRFERQGRGLGSVRVGDPASEKVGWAPARTSGERANWLTLDRLRPGSRTAALGRSPSRETQRRRSGGGAGSPSEAQTGRTSAPGARPP